MLAGSGRPRKACGQCKTQKVRCSGERPSCKRCTRLRRTCTYASVIVSGHAPSQLTKSTSTPELNASGEFEGGQFSQGRGQEACAQILRMPYEESIPTLPAQDHYLGIPRTLLSSLIDVFYSHVYNASLLLHKQLFLQSLTRRTARPHLVLSVCAFAAVFYRDANSQTSLLDNGFCIEWAERAGKLVLQEIETPHEDNVVTLLNLALFWYSRGEWRRCYVLKGSSKLPLEDLGPDRLGSEKYRTGTGLDSEILRRRFWAHYLMNCHSAESATADRPSERTLKLPLPWPEEDFVAGIADVTPIFLECGFSNGSLYAELSRSLTLHEVSVLIRTPQPNVSTRMCAIYALDAKISQWWSKLPDQFQVTPSNISTIPTGLLPKILLMQTVYRQCLTAIHASIIPLFSWSTEDDAWPAARRLSAIVAFDHAREASTLFEAVLKHYPEPSAIPSFVAYAAYCGCAIQVPFIWCCEQPVRESAYANVKTNAAMIRVLAKHWKFAAILEVHLRYIYKIHSRAPSFLENEPKYLDASKLKGIRMHSTRARDSILGHTHILWSENGDFLKKGEVPSLGAEGDSLQSSAGQTGVLSKSKPASVDEDDDPISITAELAQSHPDPELSYMSFNPSTGTDIYSEHIQDLFHPFLDPEMFILPDGELINFSHLDTSPMSLNFLDGWAPGMDTGFPEVPPQVDDRTEYG
ncbi:uncharacterized protein A1O9_08994 [Exophiala aquamarina CBS 119918]|uniref:Zn(2)-C6 fungal-type domain-containing protein n=1 Tax=Exophiala aquamarina CBS 119918 TaxID=1182545 RepID=A0A072P4B6_9EURO|nr:uncharacterized protein A1O9_08994 [Exophiala aquamarina CBS 119918]KEF54552.1 hypothetical protein A1O9_08994 [Exophiala aquamarina CBS 119918]